MPSAPTYYEALYEVLAIAPAVILRRGPTPPGDLGTVQHANKIITIDQAASASMFASALLQAVVELHRGSARAPDRRREEALVRDQAARIAVQPILSIIDPRVGPEAIAQALGVDIATVLLGLQLAADPRTR
jgi:hypothetical protein